MEKISVIVPVYNVESYLERCINSLLNQTYSNDEATELVRAYREKKELILMNMHCMNSFGCFQIIQMIFLQYGQK